MKERKSKLLDEILKLAKKDSRLANRVLLAALQKLDIEELAIEAEGVYSPDYTILIYARGNDPEVTVRQGVTVIGDLAFAQKKQLAKVTLPEGLKEIGYESFSDCDALTDITIPATVETVAPYAFGDCDRLRRVTFEGVPKKLSRHAFDSCDELHDIFVPDDAVKSVRKQLHLDEGDINYLVVGDETEDVKQPKKKEKKEGKEKEDKAKDKKKKMKKGDGDDKD